MNSKPVILITVCDQTQGVEFSDFSLSLSNHYPLAVAAAGGFPWAVPNLPNREFASESVRHCDGILLTGGDDVQTELYAKRLPSRLQKTVHPATPQRDLFELMVIDEALRQHKPLLAICRGQQILNVALGGTLYIDLAAQKPDGLNHRRMDRKDQIVHEVDIAEYSLLSQITKTKRLGVNSSHHQAVQKVAETLRPCAVSIDGIVEGLELEPNSRCLSPWLLAVQFHPERLWSRFAEHSMIFESFISACKRRRFQMT